MLHRPRTVQRLRMQCCILPGDAAVPVYVAAQCLGDVSMYRGDAANFLTLPQCGEEMQHGASPCSKSSLVRSIIEISGADDCFAAASRAYLPRIEGMSRRYSPVMQHNRISGSALWESCFKSSRSRSIGWGASFSARGNVADRVDSEARQLDTLQRILVMQQNI
jgi:hypothetical protein